MANRDTEVNNLIINELTKAEFDSAEKSETELYFVTDEKIQASDIEGLKTINNESIVGAGNIEIKSAPDLDNKTISKNTNEELQAIGVIDSSDNTTALKTWTGTLEDYNAIVTKDTNTLYNITNDTMYQPSTVYTKQETDTRIVDVLSAMYPIGAIFIGTTSTCPMSAFFGVWQLVAPDRVLQGAGSRGSVGTTINESLPNIKGEFRTDLKYNASKYYPSGAINTAIGNHSYFPSRNPETNTNQVIGFDIDASRSSSTYQDGAPVQQDAYLVNIWERVA